MRNRPGRWIAAAVVVLAPAWAAGTGRARADSDPIVGRAVEFLKKSVGYSSAGEAALTALALVKAEVPASDPGLARPLDVIYQRFEGSSYRPQQASGPAIYEAGVTILALANLDPIAHRDKIAAVARFLLDRQNGNGSWDYDGSNLGDTSISQYAVLGLWEAENAGVIVPPSAWDRAARFFLESQHDSGGFVYHPGRTNEETTSMTAAGVGSLLICARQLAPYRAAVKVANPLLIPVVSEAERRRYTAEVDPQRVNRAVARGVSWLAANFTTASPQTIGPSPFYALYGIERIGGLADKEQLGKVDWYNEGRRFLAAKQQPDGSFNASFGLVPNTTWAVLFLTKSTAKTIRKITIRRLGAGTLIGGRGLPRDLSTISVAGGHVVARPMDGGVQEMLSVLEDPRVEDAASALAGLVGRYQAEGPRALRPHRDRFRKLLTDPDQGVRRVAAWSLGRTGDLAMVLPLVDALGDPDDGVAEEAARGLQLLSRKIDGFGPARGASPEQKERAIAQWRAWYESVRSVGTANPAAEVESPPKSPTGRRGP